MSSSPIFRTTSVLLSLAPLALVAATAVTPIAAITSDPDGFDGTQVTIVGIAGTEQVGWRGESVYNLDEDGHRITVVSRGPAPASGSHLQVEGQVVVHPEGSSEIEWPPVVIETARTTAP